jgi:hypothetical protein
MINEVNKTYLENCTTPRMEADLKVSASRQISSKLCTYCKHLADFFKERHVAMGSVKYPPSRVYFESGGGGVHPHIVLIIAGPIRRTCSRMMLLITAERSGVKPAYQ